jgi:hypothetical protein
MAAMAVGMISFVIRAAGFGGTPSSWNTGRMRIGAAAAAGAAASRRLAAPA